MVSYKRPKKKKKIGKASRKKKKYIPYFRNLLIKIRISGCHCVAVKILSKNFPARVVNMASWIVVRERLVNASPYFRKLLLCTGWNIHLSFNQPVHFRWKLFTWLTYFETWDAFAQKSAVERTPRGAQHICNMKHLPHISSCCVLPPTTKNNHKIINFGTFVRDETWVIFPKIKWNI